MIDAALSIVAEEGPADLSLREVARRAGVTYAAPYHHFADKTMLLAALAGQGFEALIAELERAIGRKSTLEAELLAMAEGYVTFATSHATHYRVMFLPEFKERADADELHSAADRAYDMLLDRVARARPGDSKPAHQTLTTTVWAALHGLSLLAIDGVLQKKSALEPQKMIRAACKSIVGMVVQH